MKNAYILPCHVHSRYFRKNHLLDLPPELPAPKAVDGEVDEAVEDGAELDHVMEDNSCVTGQVVMAM